MTCNFKSSVIEREFKCWKFGAEYAHITHRSPTQLAYPDWPKEVLERPILTNIDGNTVTFKDGTTGEYDVIIKCTGYLHTFPFLPKGNLRFYTVHNGINRQESVSNFERSFKVSRFESFISDKANCRF